MKSFIVIFLIITASLFAQGWNDVVEVTDIPFHPSSGSEIDQCANKDGIHILVDQGYPGNFLKYYLLNSSGTVVRNYTFENQEVEFASIDGNNDKIYVVYKLGNQIKTRKSTNAGQNWTTSIADISIGNNECSNVDIIWGKYDNALHVVWATKDNGEYDETYYRKLTNDAWSASETVTNYGNEVGGFPTVSTSPDRVHVSYSNFNTVKAMTRDKYLTTWQNPQVAFDGQSFRERVHSGSSKLFDFYYKLEGGLGNYHSDLYATERSLSGTTWSSGTLINSYAGLDPILSSTNTVDGKTHVVYEIGGGVGYKSYNGSSWSSEFTVGSYWISPKLSQASNDLFVTWGGFINDEFLHYRQYDAVPLAPQGIAVNPYQQGNNIYAKLTWQINNEPDVFLKSSNAYLIERRIKLMDNPWGPWVFVYAPGGSVSEFIDSEVQGAGAERYYAEYRMRAVDFNNHYSTYSSTVMIGFTKYSPSSPLNGGLQATNKTNTSNINNLIYDYNLEQNYPNPFNPTTQISYSIKSAGTVSLKVYDMLGKEVANLVNETKEPGNYSANFNAADLSSGIYVYKLTTNDFTATKKLMLVK